MNIIIRALEYLVHTYRRYFKDNDIDLYKGKRAKLPKPKIYVIYTGKRKKRQEEIWEIHVRGREKDTAIRTAVEIYQEIGLTMQETVEKIAAKFNLSKDDAEEEVNKYWKA